VNEIEQTDSKSSHPHRTDKRAPQTQRRQQRLEAEREAAAQRKRKRSIRNWIIVGVIAVGAFMAWYFLALDNNGTEEVTPPTVQDSVTTITGVEPTTPESTLTIPEVPPTTTTEFEEIVPPKYTPYTDDDYGSTPCPTSDADRVLDFDDSFQNCLQEGVEYTAAFTTTAGEFKVRLDSVNTPGTTNNFISLARHKYYDGTLLHRSDPSIGIIQGGSPHNNAANDRGPGYNIKDEGTGFNYPRGLLVMARGGAPNSASAQFFFSVNENTRVLNSQGTYVVFGEVIEGIDVLQSILNSHQDIPNSRLGGAPNPPVTVQLVEIQEGEPTTQAATLTAP